MGMGSIKISTQSCQELCHKVLGSSWVQLSMPSLTGSGPAGPLGTRLLQSAGLQQVLWLMPVASEHPWAGQEELEFSASLDNTVRLCLKKEKKRLPSLTKTGELS